MSGIYGVIAPNQQINLTLDRLIHNMAQVMSHRKWYVSEHFVDQENTIAMGRVGIGIFNKSAQPRWNASHDIALVMAGEFYQVEPPPAITGWNVCDEQLVITLYEELVPAL